MVIFTKRTRYSPSPSSSSHRFLRVTGIYIDFKGVTPGVESNATWRYGANGVRYVFLYFFFSDHNRRPSHGELKKPWSLQQNAFETIDSEKNDFFFSIQWNNQNGEFAPHGTRSLHQNFYTSMRGITPFAPCVHVALDSFKPAVVKEGHKTRIGAAPYYTPFALCVHVGFGYFTLAVVYPW